MKVGETAKIILSQNASTGYGWEINEDKIGDTVEIDSKNKSGSAPRGMTGVPGTKEITVKSLAPGESTL